MDSIHVMQIAGQVPATTRQVYYTGTDALYEGYAVCYDVTASAANRDTYVAKPTLNNSVEFAGVVAPGQTIPARTSGGTWVNIISVEGAIARGVNVYTDENLAVGDLLGVIPGEFVLGKCVVGQPVARVLAATDRSTTAGVVNVQFGWVASVVSPSEINSKVVRFFDHFVSEGAASATADAAKYAATLNSGSIAFLDALTAAENTTAGGTGCGVLACTPTSTTETTFQLNGEPFSIATGQNIFFRARVACKTVVNATNYIGLSITNTTPIVTPGSDFVMFRMAAGGALTLVYDSTAGSPITSTPTQSLANLVFRELSFMIRKRKASTFDIKYWIDGVAYTATVTAASVPDVKSLSFIASAKDSTVGANAAMYIDRVEINNYIG